MRRDEEERGNWGRGDGRKEDGVGPPLCTPYAVIVIDLSNHYNLCKMYSVAPTPILPFNCPSPLWSLKQLFIA